MGKLFLDIARPFLKRSPRYTGYLYKSLGGKDKHRAWDDQGWRLIQGVEHGYQMILNLGNWSQRNAYYLGRFHDLPAQRLIKRILRPGDNFIDVGANIGMLTLCAARAVGSEGIIVAFEPHPQARTHLKMHIHVNSLSQVRLNEFALSNKREHAMLTMPTESSSRSTLLPADVHSTGCYPVQTALLDDFLSDIRPARRTLLKIDAEGSELNILMGASKLLSRPDVFVLVEVTDVWLRKLGQNAKMLFEFLQERGYQGFRPYMQPRFWSQKLVIDPVSLPENDHQFDALFISEKSVEFWDDEQLRVSRK